MDSDFLPVNEMGVVAKFCMECEKYGWRLVKIQAGFPDAVIEHLASGKQYRAELELNASHFRAHQHDLRGCDVIVCWINDWPGCLLPVLSLQNWEDFDPYDVPEVDKEITQLRMEVERLKRQLGRATGKEKILPVKGEKRYQLTPPGPGWRTERNGRYFHWRRGSGSNRESVYGGPVELLEKVGANGH